MKHKLKMLLRDVYARLLFLTGLHAVVNRLMPRRLTILFGHCVANERTNGFLPPAMKVEPRKLEDILGWFAKRYDMCTIAEGVERLRTPRNGADHEGRNGRSLLALSMDDGYVDNRTDLLPLIQSLGARATVFLESRPLDERRVNWFHKFTRILANGTSVEELVREYVELSGDETARAKLTGLGAESGSIYHVKRVLKYEADEDDRNRVLDRLLEARGVDERELCDGLYMTWEDARALEGAGVELGGHTVRHEILSRLDAERQLAEVRGCADALERELGDRPHTFAYPFGRRWDYDEKSVAAARAAGFRAAVNTHAGTNDEKSDPFQLKRVPFDDATPMHLLVAEACGGFDLMRRLGLDLSE